MEKEVTGFRAWLRSKAKIMKLYSGAIAAVIGVIVGYQQLGGPLPATQSDITELRQEVGSNTRLILGQEWERLRAKFYDLRDKLAKDPSNRDLQKDLAKAEASLLETERLLK